MQVEVVGGKAGRFLDRDTGRWIEYGSLFGVIDFEDVTENGEYFNSMDGIYKMGRDMVSLKVTKEMLRSLRPGDLVMPVFGKYGLKGRVEDMVVVKAAPEPVQPQDLFDDKAFPPARADQTDKQGKGKTEKAG